MIVGTNVIIALIDYCGWCPDKKKVDEDGSSKSLMEYSQEPQLSDINAESKGDKVQ